MSVYRKLLVVAASMALASFAYATDETTTTSSSTETTAVQPADAQPVTAATTTTTDTTSTTTTTTEKVDINKATAKELMKVKGLNASKAKAIVSYRKKHGDFKSVDDLKAVKGFKKLNDAKMKDIADQLSVN